MRGYLELVRPANVVTALADVLAGYAVAGRGHEHALAWLLPASACLYAGGVALNDIVDRHLDAVERPERPLPSGRVSLPRAIALAGALLLGGLALAAHAGDEALVIAGAIVAAVVAYNAGLKRHALLGPAGMGLCRGLNFLLGGAAIPGGPSAIWPVALIPFSYIVAVTAVSQGEVRGSHKGVALLALVILIGVSGSLFLHSLGHGPRTPLALLLVAWLGWRVFPAFWRVVRDRGPATTRHAVKTGVLSLVLLDAALATASADILYGLMILVIAGVAGAVARGFSVT
jgi:4-hydroxybenzoate polyprenyltransferase